MFATRDQFCRTSSKLATRRPPRSSATQWRPNLSKLTLAGHSRGGKTAFCMLLGLADSPLSIQFSGLIGIDPVAGFQIPGINYNMEIPPKIITNNSKPFDINVPTLIIGTELGEEAKGCLAPPCAPAGLNHEQFY